MKKVLAVSLLCLASVPAMAQHRGHGHYATGVPHHYHHHHHHRHHGGQWVAPLIIGGVIGYAITRNNETVVVQQPPIIVQQPTVISNNPTCGPWVETLQPDGSIVRQRTCTQ